MDASLFSSIRDRWFVRSFEDHFPLSPVLLEVGLGGFFVCCWVPPPLCTVALLNVLVTLSAIAAAAVASQNAGPGQTT